MTHHFHLGTQLRLNPPRLAWCPRVVPGIGKYCFNPVRFGHRSLERGKSTFPVLGMGLKNQDRQQQLESSCGRRCCALTYQSTFIFLIGFQK